MSSECTTTMKFGKMCLHYRKAISVSLIAILLITFFYAVGEITAPFLVGALLAYILHPLVEYIQNSGKISKGAIALVIAILIWVFLIIFCVSTLPVLYSQLINLYEILKHLNIETLTDMASTKLNINIKDYLPSSFEDLTKDLPNDLIKLSNQILLSLINSTKIAIDIFMMIIIAPLTCYFVLKEWNEIGSSTYKLLRDMPLTRIWVQNINTVFRTFLRGQFILAVSFVFFYTIAFIAIGLNSALILGLLSGITCFLPYIGAVISFTVCIIVGIIQFSFSPKLLLLSAIFVGGHLLDIFWASPKLVGDKMGLHPLLTIFAMLASAELFGIVGMFFAMPIAVIIQMAIKNVLNGEVKRSRQ